MLCFSNLFGNNLKDLRKTLAPTPKHRDHQQYKSMQKLPRHKIPSQLPAKQEPLYGKKIASKKRKS